MSATGLGSRGLFRASLIRSQPVCVPPWRICRSRYHALPADLGARHENEPQEFWKAESRPMQAGVPLTNRLDALKLVMGKPRRRGSRSIWEIREVSVEGARIGIASTQVRQYRGRCRPITCAASRLAGLRVRYRTIDSISKETWASTAQGSFFMQRHCIAGQVERLICASRSLETTALELGERLGDAALTTRLREDTDRLRRAAGTLGSMLSVAGAHGRLSSACRGLQRESSALEDRARSVVQVSRSAWKFRELSEQFGPMHTAVKAVICGPPLMSSDVAWLIGITPRQVRNRMDCGHIDPEPSPGWKTDGRSKRRPRLKFARGQFFIEAHVQLLAHTSMRTACGMTG